MQEELDALDVERESLLDVVMTKMQTLGITEKIQRVLVALPYAKASDNGVDVSNELSATVSRQESEDEKQGTLSGISLAMPGVCLLLLEGPQRLVIGTLREFQAPGSRMKVVTASMHILLSVQDTPGRCFPGYFNVILKMDAAPASVPDLEAMVKLVPEISVNLLKFGKEMSDMDGVLREDAIDNIKNKMVLYTHTRMHACIRRYAFKYAHVCIYVVLHLQCTCACVYECVENSRIRRSSRSYALPLLTITQRFPLLMITQLLQGDGLPRVQDILGLTQSSDVLTLTQFFDLYYSPDKCLGSPLDSEVVWPLPPSLTF